MPGLERLTTLRSLSIIMDYGSFRLSWPGALRVGDCGSQHGQASSIDTLMLTLKPMKELCSLELEDILSDVKLSRFAVYYNFLCLNILWWDELNRICKSLSEELIAPGVTAMWRSIAIAYSKLQVAQSTINSCLSLCKHSIPWFSELALFLKIFSLEAKSLPKPVQFACNLPSCSPTSHWIAIAAFWYTLVSPFRICHLTSLYCIIGI